MTESYTKTVWQDSFSCCDNISMYFTYYKWEVKQQKKRKTAKQTPGYVLKHTFFDIPRGINLLSQLIVDYSKGEKWFKSWIAESTLQLRTWTLNWQIIIKAWNYFLKVFEEVLKQLGFKNCRTTVYSVQLFFTLTLMHENEWTVFKRVSGKPSRDLETNMAGP